MELFDPTLTSSTATDVQVHSLQRSNIRLSANIKYVYDNTDSLYLESINSSTYLASSVFKSHKINDSVSLPLAVKNFMNTSSNLTEWYETKAETTDQAKEPYEQRDCMYEWGAYYDGSSPLQKNRFFAPLWTYGGLPEMFCIFRLQNLSYANNIKAIIKDGTLVRAVDMRAGHNKYFDWVRNHLSDRNFRPDAIQVGYSGDDKAIGYYGFSAENGNWVQHKEYVLDDYCANERMILETNNNITNGFKRNNLIHPALFNFEFTFEDPEAFDGWGQYVGFYCSLADITTSEARDVVQQNPEVLCLSNYKGDITRSTVQADPYLQVSSKITGFKSEELPAQAEVQWLWIPPKNSYLKVTYNNIIVYQFKFDTYGTVRQAKNALLNDFRNAKLNQVSLRMFDDPDGRFFITAINSSDQYENLKLELPSSLRSTYGFRVVNTRDIIVSAFPNEDILSFNNTQYLITARFLYKDFYVIRLDQPVQLTTTTNLELLSYVYPDLFIASFIPHKDFDYSIDRSSNYDPVDSDPDKNKAYLLDAINQPNFVGGWDVTTGQTLDEYKDLLRSMIEDHFKSIIIPKDWLLKDINLVTLEAESVLPNEFLRLEESTNPNTKDLNKIMPFITKWGHSQGTNVYARPYDLNLSLALRYDGFAPSFSNSNRDLRTHTHSWYLIGEGLPPYFDNLRKAMGYTNAPISQLDLIDTDVDAYDKLLTHNIDGYSQSIWSDMKLRDGSQTNYYTFFRGGEIEFTGNYEGYRFAAILTTRDIVNATSVSDYVTIVDNVKFKTLTVLIKFYIPDPVLTSLEGGIPYYLDRSLLYFSNTVYSTKKLTSFGQDVISMDLYNTINRKYFNGVDVGFDWSYTVSGTTYYQIRRGDIFRWNGNFLDVLEQGDDFSWRTTKQDDTTITEYKAVNIIEIQEDFFWCEDIQMRTFRQEDPLTQNWRSLKTDLANWTGEDGLLTKDNDWYMSKAISYYNSIYDIVVSPRTNNKRYKQISYGAVANILNNYAINYSYVTEDTYTESTKRIKVYEPSYFPILNSIKSVDNQLVQLNDTQLMFPLYRYSGTYSPIFRTIYHPAKLSGVNNSYGTINKINSDLRYIKKWGTTVLNEQVVIEDRNYTLNPINDRMLKLYSDDDNYTLVNVYTNKEAAQSFVSSIFKYDDTIELITNTPQFNLKDLLKDLLLSLVFDKPFADGTLPTATFLEVLKTYVNNSTPNSMLLEDVQDYPFMNFYIGTFLRLYTIDQILTSDGQVIQYNQVNTFEYLMEANYGRVILKRI